MLPLERGLEIEKFYLRGALVVKAVTTLQGSLIVHDVNMTNLPQCNCEIDLSLHSRICYNHRYCTFETNKRVMRLFSRINRSATQPLQVNYHQRRNIMWVYPDNPQECKSFQYQARPHFSIIRPPLNCHYFAF